MKIKVICISLILLMLGFGGYSQVTKRMNNIPPSYTRSTKADVDHIQVYPPSAKLIAEEIEETEKNGTFYKVGILVPVNTTVKNSGTWETLDNGQLVWRLRFSSEGAKASALYFDKFDIPNGASVYVYTSDMKIVDGPYFRGDNPSGEEYMIGNIVGDDITIEYVAPMTKSFDGKVSSDNTAPIINIGEYAYIFRGEGGFERGTRATGFGSSESCEVNVNCSVGADWRIQQRGVARIYVREGFSTGYCTGTLINNTSNDGTPYFLTANHCGPNATASNFGQWKFRFNYEASGCSNPSSESSINYTDFTGCTKVAEGSNNGGSDFYLLKLTSFTKQNAINIGAIYNGWDRGTSAPTGGGAGIHHPSGDIKKISFFTSMPTTASYNGGSDMTGATNAHWKVTWVNSSSKTGVTEGGSSGSPIFNSAGRVFGTLSGGASSCSASSYSRYDLYGKMSFHWENSVNGTTNAYKLKPWLDPTNTGATTCDYYDPANSTPNTLSVSPTSLSYTVNGESKTVTVTSNTSWTATTSASWLTVSPASGSTNGTITARASANTAASQRTATITVSANGVSPQTISVTQAGTSGVEPVEGSAFTYDFESCTAWAVDNFLPCQTYDGDGFATYGITNVSFTNSGYTGSYIAFQNGTANGFTAHGGTKFGCCMAAMNGQNNDWFITPAVIITSGTTFSFWARSANNEFGLEQFRVAVSNDDYNYTYIAGSSTSSISAPVEWTQFSYDLSQYAGQTLYLAIICVSNDVSAFFIDDIVVSQSDISNTFTPIRDIQYTTAENGDSPLNNHTVWVKGVVTSNFINTPYRPVKGYSIQDANEAWSGVWVFDSINNPNIGDSVRFQALVTEFYGLTELKNVTNFEILDMGVVSPIDVTVNEANSEAYEGCYVRVECVRSVGHTMPYGNWKCVNEANDSVSFSHNFASDAYTIEQDRTYRVSGIVEYSHDNYYVNYPSINDIVEDCYMEDVPHYTITVLSANDIQGSVSGGGTFNAGTEIQILASPYSGYRFLSWNDGNTDNPRVITVTADATYIASFVQNGQDPAVYSSFSATACGSYTWNDQTYIESGEYRQTFTSANSIDSIVTLSLTIYELPQPIVAVYGELDACNPSSVAMVTGIYNSYLWSNGETTQVTSTSNPGFYYVEVTDENGCTGVSEQVNIGLSSTLPDAPQISVVGIDNLNRNVVTWSAINNENANAYNIYRENNVADVYELMANVDASSQTYWIDETADPSSRAYRYKVTAVDECGGESPMSNYHKTMHLTINQGIGTAWNLIWSHYEGFEFGTYRIYRGTSPSNMTMIGEVPSNLNSYTDNTNTANEGFFYQVEVVRNTRTRNADISSRSNIVDNGYMPEFTITVISANPNRGSVIGGGTYTAGSIIAIAAFANEGYQFAEWDDSNTDNPRQIMVTENATYIASFDPATNIEETSALNVNIFPNPTNDNLNITSSETISEIEIVNVMGQVVYRAEVNADNAVCNVKGLTAGVYFVKIYGNPHTSTGSLQQAQFATVSGIVKKFIKE